MPTFKARDHQNTVNDVEELSKPNKPMTTPSVLKPIDPKKPTLVSKNGTQPAMLKKTPSKKSIFPLITLLVVLIGIGSGYIFASMNSKGGSGSLLGKDKDLKREVATDQIQVGTKVGVADESTFRDDATGTVEKGGLNGEGSHKLVRPGGEDQTAALTSSIIDLDQFVGRKVHVWRETINSQKVAWFMDIGKLEVLE